jgi:hypothetical protein
MGEQRTSGREPRIVRFAPEADIAIMAPQVVFGPVANMDTLRAA